MLAIDQGFPQWRALGDVYRGWATVKDGYVAEGISLLCNGVTASRTAGAELWFPSHIVLLTAAYRIAERIEEASAMLDDALHIVERTGGRWMEAELHRHKGQLMLQRGRPDTAEELYRKALTIAKEQEAKLWELRASVSLAWLRRDQSRLTEARDLLAPVYGWFTEGFDTPDLKEAKALLDALQI